MSRRKRLLFVTDAFPYPLDRGQHVRVYNVLAACADAFDVTFVGPAPPEGIPRESVEQHCQHVRLYKNVPDSWRDRTALAVRTVFSAPGLPKPATVRRYLPFVAALDDVRPETFDMIWAERPHVARLCAQFSEKTIVDLDDLEHLKILRLLALPQSPLDRTRSIYQFLRYRDLETNWAKRFLAAVVCSREDRSHLERSGCRNGFVVPNAPAVGATHRASHSRRAPRPRAPLRVAFLGNVTHPPNADAIEFIASEILPRLRAQDPGTSIHVIGPNASDATRARYDCLHFRGFVGDLGAALGEYDVMLAPLRFGGGTKLKILDGMAHRIPIVTTAVGAEGLELRAEKQVLLAETPDAIAECVLRLKNDELLAAQLTENAYAHVCAHFSWSTIRHQLTEWLRYMAHDDAREWKRCTRSAT